MRNDFAAGNFEYFGNLLSLLNPYGLLTGLLFVLLFAVHGSLYAAIKTTGPLSERAGAMASRLWLPLLVVAVVFLGYTYPATTLYANYLKAPVLLLIPLVAVAALLQIKVSAARGKLHRAFACSCLTIVFVCFTGIAGLFPNLIPSSLDPASSLTIYNSSSSAYTLKIMTVVALIFVPIVIAYKVWVYRIFRERITDEEVLGNSEAY